MDPSPTDLALFPQSLAPTRWYAPIPAWNRSVDAVSEFIDEIERSRCDKRDWGALA